jgi:hypothetical protein
MSEIYQSLSHSKWNCKYHIVFVPKGRRKVLFGKARRHLGTIFHALAQQKGVSDYRGARDARPCPHVSGNSAEASGGVGHWFSQGQKQYCHSSAVVCQRTQPYSRALFGLGLSHYNQISF